MPLPAGSRLGAYEVIASLVSVSDKGLVLVTPFGGTMNASFAIVSQDDVTVRGLLRTGSARRPTLIHAIAAGDRPVRR